jgi:hypothetical protein
VLKNIFCLFIVNLGLLALAQAQDIAASASPTAPPSYCNPCIFYSGDFDPRVAKEPNGLLNGLFPGAIDGEVWVPFTVVNKIRIQGLFVNELFASAPPTTVPVTWAIRAGVSEGSGGTLQCSGTGTAHAVATGRSFTFASTTYTEWTYRALLANSDYCELTNIASGQPGQLPQGGKGQCPPNCYLAVTPDDTSAGAAPVVVSSGFLSDVPNPANHHFGSPNVLDNSFFSSTSYGYNFVSATTACAVGPPLAITQVGCHMFSVGLIGIGK